MWWAVDLNDQLQGPFPKGHAAAEALCPDGDWDALGGHKHEGFEYHHPREACQAILLVGEGCPEGNLVGMTQKLNRRIQIQWAKERPFGTIYKTSPVWET